VGSDAAEDLEKRALASAVAADDAQYLTVFDLEADILERPELLDLVALNDPPADDVDCLARDVAGPSSDDVAQRSTSGFGRLICAPADSFWTGFRR